MIKLVFSINREIFRVTIKGREIFYSDRMWRRAIRLIPKDEEFQKKIVLSRNKIPHHILEFFELTKMEKEEYDKAKTEEELANICINDTKKKGCLLVKKEDGNL